MFDWTISSWFLTLLIAVLAVNLTAGLARYYYRRTARPEPGAVSIYYNLAAAALTILALVFFIRLIVELA